ncbi:MAG: septum formation initiator family protein [Eubacterium sp.]
MKQYVKKQVSKRTLVYYIVGAVFSALMIYCVIALLNNSVDIHRLNAQAADNNARYEQQLQENEEIKAILDSDSKDEYIEQKAREKGYVKEGETVYYDISSSK